MRKILFAALVVAGATFAAAPASAAPLGMSGPAVEHTGDNGLIQQARHWRGHHGMRHHGMRHHGWRHGHHYGWRHRHHPHRM